MSEPKQPESPVDAMPEKFYLTTPIYYVNARPHIGHAYSTLVADVLARRHRLLGHDTFFLTGTDEHGQKIERSAAVAGIPPQQFADQVSKTFSDLWQRMGITNDAFIRTTDPRHKRGVQQLFQTLYDQGHIYLSTYTGQYSIGEEMFVDGPPGTIGPDGRPTETVTEENFFFRLSAFQQPLLDLIESNALKITPESSRNEVLSFLRGNVADTFHHARFTAVWDSDAEVSKEEALKLALELGLLRYSAPSESSPTGLLYVPGALKDLSVSRSSFTWGIPVPEAVQKHAGTTQKHVIYVWLDALANYMTAIGYGSDSSADREQFEKYWPANLHLVGKEITRFHCVYWPAFLLAAGLPTPKQITANGWLLFDNAKMSKSKGNVVRTETILDAFGEHVYKKQFPDSTKAEQDLFAADVLRYFLLREIPFGQDGTFSFEAMITRYNADLANGYGNLVSRILRMIHNDDGGVWPPTTQAQALDKSKMPEWWAQHPYSTIARFADDETSLNQPLGVEGSTGVRMILTLSGRGESGVGLDGNANVYGGRCFYAQAAYSVSDVFQVSVDPLLRAAKSVDDDLDFFKFLQLLSQHIRIVDVFLSETRPWKRQSIDPRRTEIIVAAAEYVRIITAILYPLLPYATARVWQQLGLGDIEAAAKAGDLKNLQWGGLKPGEKLGPLSPIFPRADKSLAALMEDLEASAAAKPQPEKVPAMLTTEPTPDTSQQPAAPATHPAEPLKGQGDPIPTSTPDPKDDPTNPAAPPRTASLDTENPGAQVAASYAITTGPDGTPGHTEAHASGIFAGQPDTPQIAIDDFTKIDLRVAKILVAERIPKADKLLRLEVDLGYEQRQILSGIAEHYTPEELIGRKIVIIANLAPRKMRGLESRGMLLAASEGEGGKPILATFGEDIAVGTRLR